DSLGWLTDQKMWIQYGGVIAVDYVEFRDRKVWLQANDPANPLVKGLLIFAEYANRAYDCNDELRWLQFEGGLAKSFLHLYHRVLVKSSLTATAEKISENAPSLFSRLLRALRYVESMGQQECARKAGIKASSLNVYEQGNVFPGPENAEALETVFGLEPRTIS